MRSFEKIGVTLRDRDQMTHLPVRHTECRADGRFEIKNVYPGRYHVEAELRFEETDPDRLWKAQAPIIQVPEDIEEIVVQIQ